MNFSHRFGLETIEDSGIQKPFKLYPLNLLGFKALNCSIGEHHSLIMFENLEGKEVLYSVGVESADNFVHLGCSEEAAAVDHETPFREIPIFSQRKILSFQAHDSPASIVLIEGDEKLNNGFYNHRLPGGKVAHGMLHFYKKGGEWHYVSEDEYQSKKASLPAITFAARCPINDIPSKEWEDLDKLAEEILEKDDVKQEDLVHNDFVSSSDGKPVAGPLYYSKCLINNEEIEVCHSETTVLNEDKYSVHPLIFMRIAKKIKKDSVLPSIALEKFYEQGDCHGITLQVVPKLDIQKNSKLISLTKDSWNSLNENVSKFDIKYQREFLKAMDSLVSDKDMDFDFKKEFNPSDLKFEDNDDKDLKKLNETILKQVGSMYWMLNKNFFDVLAYSCREQKGLQGSARELLDSVKSSLLSSVKSKFVDKEIGRLPTGSQGHIKIKRHLAARFAEAGKVDHTGEFTIFGQIYQQCKSDKLNKTSFRRNGTDDMIFECQFAGEGSIDVGGPFRECLTNLVDELEGTSLPLLIKTPNNRNNHGYNRECFCLNPASFSPSHRELFIFLGYFLGFSIRTKSAMDWHFPPIFWKQLLEQPCTLQDFEGLDAYSY